MNSQLPNNPQHQASPERVKRVEVYWHAVSYKSLVMYSGFEGKADGTLTLMFSNGQRLTILDNSKEYESYDITRPGQTIVV